MKLIRQSKLYYKEGNSDKVYELDLCQIAENSFLVNFRYGRRGSSLKEGTKTPEAVSLEKAELIFSEYEAEKIQKGYRSQNQIQEELPVLELKPDSVKGVILHRLQDAVLERNSFKTVWKTSRVVWKAGYLKIQEAIPYLLKLALTGDELQLYSCLHALCRLKAKEAANLFQTILLQTKQKTYIKNVATDGLLNILEGEDRSKFIEALLLLLPKELAGTIENRKFDLLDELLKQLSEKKQISYFSNLYLLTSEYPQLLPVIRDRMKEWPMVPPYFKLIRSIYKLAQMRNDYHTVAMLAYKFEHEAPMYQRSSSQWVHVPSLGESFNLKKEFTNPNCRVAYNQHTKAYFQRNALNLLVSTGSDCETRQYLQLAVALLLQYNEDNYTDAIERPTNNYGTYDYRNRTYAFTLIHYAECSDSLLLSAILFGKDPRRTLNKKLKYIYGRRDVTSNQYFYSPEHIVQTRSSSTEESDKNKEHSSTKGSFLTTLKNIFSNKKQETKPSSSTSPSSIVDSKVVSNRMELYPEHWDAMPEAYLQLLVQAQMKLIHNFAYSNLKNHPEYDSLISKLDEDILLKLLSSNFEIPSTFGLEVLKKRTSEFSKNHIFIGKLLDSPNPSVRNWAMDCLTSNPDWFMEDLDFVLSLLFNPQEDLREPINKFIKEIHFSSERLEALVGKTVIELIELENSERNSLRAKNAITRISAIAGPLLEQMSWDFVTKLLNSNLSINVLLASEILIAKSKKIAASEIPVSLVNSFLESEIKEVRENGILLLIRYPESTLETNSELIFNQINSEYLEVVQAILALVNKMIAYNSKTGDTAILYFIYALIRKEKFEGAHSIIRDFVNKQLRIYWNTGLSPKDVVKLVHAQYRESQLLGYDILSSYDKIDELTLGQIVSFGNHEMLAVRTWCWNYFTANTTRILREKEKSLGILDSKWDDTRTFAFEYFRNNFKASDWDTDTLVSIVDSVREDVEQFGKELIQSHFQPEHAIDYLTKLSEHPSVGIQLFVSNYLSHYASGNPAKIKELDFYFRSVLSRVNKARVTKNRIFKFLSEEALKSEEAASCICKIMDDISAQSTIGDKAECILILAKIKASYPNLEMHLNFANEIYSKESINV